VILGREQPINLAAAPRSSTMFASKSRWISCARASIFAARGGATWSGDLANAHELPATSVQLALVPPSPESIGKQQDQLAFRPADKNPIKQHEQHPPAVLGRQDRPRFAKALKKSPDPARLVLIGGHCDRPGSATVGRTSFIDSNRSGM